MEAIISAENLSKSYHGQAALKSLSLTVKQGEAYGLLGPNGAGKTTAIECILGIRRADQGKVGILGLDPVKQRKKLFEKVGVQFQESEYQDKITVSELCEVTASLYRDPADSQKLLSEFGIGHKERSLVRDLSGGQRQRLFLVLALLPKPGAVFLDELTTGLDPKARRDVWNILRGLKEKGLTILMTSHFMDEVEALCDQICILKQGSQIFQGTCLEAVLQSPYEKFEDAYLWYTEEGGTNVEAV